MIVTQNIELTYINERGSKAELKTFGEFWLQACDETLTNQIAFDKQWGIDGGIFNSDSLDPRRLFLSGYIYCKSQLTSGLKSQLYKVFNPKLWGKLYWYNKSTKEKRVLSCKPVKGVELGIKSNRPYFNIELIAFDPFWHGEEVVEVITEVNKRAVFPLGIREEAFVFGTKANTLKSKFDNIGDVDVGFSCILMAESGTVKNPMIINEMTGEMLKFNINLDKHDFIRVVNYPHTKQILLNDKTDIFYTIEPDESEFFSLFVGANIIGYRAEENCLNLKVVIRYGPDYIGVG